ncbi:phenoloxidase-activating factor 1-like [Leptinotarsa decemlineata]|uniref:phenoloxidase-activating factor 1-like n=1 Tax=Leptinotarsa decemlineata TaxID=7539 RepID=UPI003D306CB1
MGYFSEGLDDDLYVTVTSRSRCSVGDYCQWMYMFTIGNMCRVRSARTCSLVRLLLWFCFLAISKCQDWVIEDEGCITPDGESGDCTPIRQCQPMVDFLSTAKRPLSNSASKRLNAFTCSFASNQVWVCCPPGPIVIPNEPVVATPPTVEPERPPPDVTQHRNYRMLPQECGYLETGDKIRNGVNASLNEFPWMALLSYRTRQGPQFKCGGTIINERYILTAAHCISKLNDPLLGVRVGEHNILTRTDCEIMVNGQRKCSGPVQDLAIEEILPHPRFNPNVIQNDIGLLRVSRMNLNVENVRPVCLPIDNSRDAKFRYATVTGWGVTDSGQNSMVLQKVELPIVSLEDCRNVYKSEPKANINYLQLCAGGRDKKDSCPGDSGGPLHVAAYINEATRYVQQGVVSFGPRFCGLEGYPGVYTRVAYYMDWILDTIRR